MHIRRKKRLWEFILLLISFVFFVPFVAKNLFYLSGLGKFLVVIQVLVERFFKRHEREEGADEA